MLVRGSLNFVTLDLAMGAALDTLEAEQKALGFMKASLEADPAALRAAIDLVWQLKGRLIVTGVGKSGHIGGKIAATLASTGTPAFFVHPTEALHGDLGMITREDAVLALSHSGESKELAAIITYCTRFEIPLIAITGKPTSTLAQAATCVLNTYVTQEACPLNLAPTTSTTAALALADALAVGLMSARGFGPTDFAVFHPGGKLGAQLLHVREVMLTAPLPLLPETATLRDVLHALTTYNLGCVGLTRADGALAGMFTDGDLKRRVLAKEGTEAMKDFFDQPIAQLMSVSPKTTPAHILATAAVASMQALKVKALWVIDENHRPLGLLRLDECLAKGVI